MCRSAIAAVAIVALASSSAAIGQTCDHGEVTVTGTVRGLGVLQIEPQEDPQTSFFLDQTDFSCTRESILIMAPGLQACSSGDRATVMGSYLPPDELSPVPMIDGAKVRCHSR